MAAVLREQMGGLQIKILDAPIIKAGWRTTKELIIAEQPDVVCVGEETVSSHEAIKIVQFVKQEFPTCRVIAGGPHFSHMAEHTLQNFPVDYIVFGEGELTLLELIEHIYERKEILSNLDSICGIGFLWEGRLRRTAGRMPMKMDDLPMPAYDLLPMELYGKGASTHKDLVAVEHSRGCTASCNFCILWKQLGKPGEDGEVTACYRTKSPEKSFEEVRYLHRRYGRKTFCWVDPTWNAIPSWNRRFSELMIESGLEVDHSVWMRADYILRDNKNGSFDMQMRAGVKQIMIGVERLEDDQLESLEKIGYSYEKLKETFELIQSYPDVLSVATYIYGLPDDTPERISAFYDKLRTLPIDIGVPIPLTPNPGTKYFHELVDSGLVEVKKFKYYNFVNPIARTHYMSRSALLYSMLTEELKTFAYRKGYSKMIKLKKRRGSGFRGVGRSKTSMTFRILRAIAQQSLLGTTYNFNIKPEWYDR